MFVLLKGKLVNYKRRTDHAMFMFTEREQGQMGATAIAASLVGLSGPAISTAMSTADLIEEAHHLEFELDGKPVRGWVWRAPPLRNGDKVEVVAEWQEDHYELAAIARPADRLIALYPHCSRGEKSHWRNIWKWWQKLPFFAITLFAILVDIVALVSKGEALYFGFAFPYYLLGTYLFFYATSALAVLWAGKRWSPKVRLAETVFATLGWPNPSEVDLVRSSKKAALPEDPPELGVLYFRY